MKAKETLHAYIRVSTPGQVALSVPEQRLDAKYKAKALGMNLKEYIDSGISASTSENINNRPAMQELLQAIKDGQVKAIYTEDSTRMSREEISSGIIFGTIKKYGVILYYKMGQGLNLQNPQDMLQVSVLDSFAQFEGAIRQQRFGMGLKQASRKGKFVGPNTPFGYEKNEKGHLKKNEEEEVVFLSIVKDFLSGEGTYTIANRLNSKGTETRSMKKDKNIKWNAGTIASMLKNTVYYGVRYYGKDKKGKVTDTTVETTCDPIIDKKTYDLIQEQFKKNRIHSKRHNTVHKYLLRSLIKCGCENCGNNFFGFIKENRGQRSYNCLSKKTGYKSCKNKNINLDRLDNAVWCAVRHTPHFYQTMIEELNRLYNEEEIKKEISILAAAQKRLEKEYERLLNKMISMDSESPEAAINAINKLLKEKEKEIKVNNSDLAIQTAKLSSKNVNPLGFIDKKYIKNGAVSVDNIDDKIRLVQQVVKQITVTFLAENNSHKIDIEIAGSKPITFHLKASAYRYRKGFEQKDDPFRYANENGLLFKMDVGSVTQFKENFNGLVS
jgi:DNA invertase Pin-like site-specific DNA recombinase